MGKMKKTIGLRGKLFSDKPICREILRVVNLLLSTKGLLRVMGAYITFGRGIWVCLKMLG